jgi:hypothetical protein
MKAYKVTDRAGYSEYSCVVFAETPGKAVQEALGTDEFPYGDWTFIELKARRFPEMDKHYRGKSRMDWDNAEDRVALVVDGGYTCDSDYSVLSDCEECPAKDDCSLYEELLEDQAEMEAEASGDG